MDEGGFEMKRIQVAAVFAMALALPLAAQAATMDWVKDDGGNYAEWTTPEGLILDSVRDGEINIKNQGGDGVVFESGIGDSTSGLAAPIDMWSLTPPTGGQFDLLGIDLWSSGSGGKFTVTVTKDDQEISQQFDFDQTTQAMPAGWTGLSSAVITVDQLNIQPWNGEYKTEARISIIEYGNVTPEPATMGLLGLGGLVALRRRRTR
jgi:hypothetical protein